MKTEKKRSFRAARKIFFMGIAVCGLLSIQACGSAPSKSSKGSDVEGAESRIELTPCGESPGIECGTFEVWEDRESRSGRKIDVFVKVMRATGSDPAPDPYLYFAGGPGGSVSNMPPEMFEELRKRRDIVLVDQRGTGKSHPLACPGWSEKTPQQLLDPYLLEDDVVACRDALTEIADPRQYTTWNFVDDVADVIKALGYDKVNLHGASYGTKPVQVFLRRHPEHVRSAVLHGVSLLGEKYPLAFPFTAERVFDRFVAACNADDKCHGVHGDPGEHLKTVLKRFEGGPVSLNWKGQTLSLSRDTMMEGIRHLMYGARGTAMLPRLLHQAAVDNDYTDLVNLIIELEGSMAMNEGQGWYSGLWLSVSCSEGAQLITEEELRRAEQDTLFGRYRPQRHAIACALWPKGEMPQGFVDPVVSDAPVLILSGSLDPATANENGDAVARHLKNSLHLIAAEGHGATDWECSDGIVNAFIEKGTTEGIDASCLSVVTIPTWSPKKAELDLEVAKTLVGKYTIVPGNEGPVPFEEVDVTLVDGDIYLSVPEGFPPIALTPMGNTKFAIEKFGFDIDFQIGETGDVHTLVMTGGGDVKWEFRPADSE